MRTKSILVLTPLLCLLGACALEPRRSEPPPQIIVQPASPSEADQLLAYMMQVRRLDAREFAAEREQMRGTFLAANSDLNRIKLAVLLSMAPGSSSPTPQALNASDDIELIALLEPVVNTPGALATELPAGAAEVRALATLVYGMALDRKKLRDQWRDAQARLSALRRDESKELEARALRTRVEELERKLDALKSIDRSVNRRSETQRDVPRN